MQPARLLVRSIRGLAALALSFGLAGSAFAQQGQRDPFNGQFGAVEIAAPPAEAARQAMALGAALSALPPQRSGQVDVYVIAASLWSDPVFEREATEGAAALSRHLGAENRVIVLSAGSPDGRSLPSAAPNDIAAAIGRVGELADPQEDLVVLFFTSHGHPNGAMALREAQRMGSQMRPSHLRDMLTAAGIGNRLVIISSCFSGAFIAPLMDERSIVLTAAQADRSSFGCQPERDWTFFGDALFAQSLPQERSLLTAFERAKGLIAQWERDRNLSPPSNPQSHVGGVASRVLTQAERDARD
ncbi:MAG: C13 family peptidase [Hyphomonadaceae bacterium]